MSYILDALKHSQDSRSRGEVPDLVSQVAGGRPRLGRSERLWRLVAVLAVLLLLAVLVGLGWQRWLAPSVQTPLAPLVAQPVPAAPAPVPAPQPVAVPAPAPAPSVAMQPPAVPPAVAQAQTSGKAAEPGEQSPGLAALHELAGVRVKVDAPAVAADAGAPANPPAQAVQPLDLPREVGRVAPGYPTAAGRALPPLPGRPGVGGAPVEVLREPPAASEAALSAEFGNVEHWKMLPAAIQQQLRDMPFNVHIYASDPKLRFVRTGGRTLREGDAINADLRMLHITRDGVIVGYKGGQYWMRLS